MVDVDHRKIVFLYFRIRNRLSAYCNRIKLSTIGVKYGKNCMIQGHLYITLFPSAQLTIGDNLHYSSGWNINALCANRCGSIYATENAKFKMGIIVVCQALYYGVINLLLLVIMLNWVEIAS